MEQLRSELRSNLTSNLDVSVLNEQVWGLPVISYDVKFDRVKRLKMDILMKMLLFAFQETEIRRAATLADMLFVEELFISDLIDKMQRTKLIQSGKKGYQLTAKGYEYLEKGIFEEEMKADQALVSFSAVHDEYLMASENELPANGASLEPYRYAVKEKVKKDRIHQLLAKETQETDEQGLQILVTEVASCIERTVEHIPCIEFQLFDRKQDIYFARVWNTG
ncbi:MAG TPA: hypothetical protein VK947_01350, partial [Planococcus sp. (in: firmicutes)]|nr:hypothetical protein [Planococcus sp. (in: firmicutes)]